MDDYSALAQRIAVSVSGVSGALILSRDGLVLGAYPNEDESLAKPAWLKFIALGEPERSFVEFSDKVWAYVKRGPYAAFATAEAGTRPGVLVDQMEQVLLVVEEGRTRREPMRVPDANAAPSGKPRTSLHPQLGKPAPAEAAEVSVAAAPPAEAVAAASPERVAVERDESSSTSDETPLPPPRNGNGDGEGQAAEPAFDDSEVDPVLLAKEFSGLLQLDSDDDD